MHLFCMCMQNLSPKWILVIVVHPYYFDLHLVGIKFSCFVSESFTPELETCEMKLEGDEGMFSSDDIPEERMKMIEQYNTPVDCMWAITVKDGWKVCTYT